MKYAVFLIALTAAVPALAEESRQLDTHEHGVGTLNIAIDGAAVEMAFDAPGADIVGFEYAAKSEADLAAIEAAVVKLVAPFELFVLPDAAGCSVVEALAEIEGKEAQEEEHDDHTDKRHEDHAEETDETAHTEFHAEYTLNCDTPDALTEITFAYFEAFPNAQEVEVQIVSASGAQAFEVERDAPVLDLGR